MSTQARRARPPAARARRRLGDGPARPDGPALSRRRLRQSRLLRLGRRLSRAAARCGPLRRHGRGHDLRHRQQGSRSLRRLDLRPDHRGLLDGVLGGLPRPRPGHRGPDLPGSRPRDRPDQRRPRHDPEGAGLHRDADDAADRPRHRARPDRRQVDPLFDQGAPSSRSSSASARATSSASTTRSRSRSWWPRSARMCSARPAGATRPSPPAATSRPRSTPASRRTGSGSAPICCRRCAPRSQA